ncbi:MAG: hypothetical protein BWX51_01895 [Bacteroidetes bacterium ADurb.Bin012]|jgi:hypothetical protein|nr:MAG: hypothetical protein BWX51_01895 [Bacteroidetes bacterium ADurb.Bin012]
MKSFGKIFRVTHCRSQEDNDIEGFLYILYIFDKSLALLPRIPRIRSYGIALAMKSD